MRELIDVGEDRKLRAGGLTARRAGHTAQNPLVGAPRTDDSALAREERLTRVREHRNLWQAATSRAFAVRHLRWAKRCRDFGERLEHRRGTRPRQERVGRVLSLAGEPRLHHSLEVAVVEPDEDRLP